MSEAGRTFLGSWAFYVLGVYVFRRLAVAIDWVDESWTASLPPALIVGTIAAIVMTWWDRRKARRST